MNILISSSLFFLAAGILTSVSILSVYQILFGIPFFYCTYLAFKNNEYQLPKSAFFLLAFTGVAIISLGLNFELLPKPSQNFGKLKYFFSGLGGIYVFRYWLPRASDKTKKILTTVFLVSVIVAGVYAWFSINDKGRAKGLTDTMRYGYGSAMILLVLLSAVLHKEKTSRFFNWKLGAIAFVIGFSGMYLTYTRGALLGFLCGLPFVLYFYRPKLGLIFGGLALAGVLSLGSIYLFGSGNYQSRFLQNKNNDSDNIRRSQWQAAVIAIKERPVLGWGLSNFHSQLKRIKEENDLEAKFYVNEHAHNLFLEVGAGTGILGLVLFTGWLVMWAWESFRIGGLNRALIIPFGVALVVSSQFEVTTDANNASMIFFLYAMSSAFTGFTKNRQ